MVLDITHHRLLLLMILLMAISVWSAATREQLKKSGAAKDLKHFVNITSDPTCYGVYNPESQTKCPVQPLPNDYASCRPNYFIAGTRKGGSTSLHRYLASHPSVYPYKIKGKRKDGESLSTLGSPRMNSIFSYPNINITTDQLVGDSTVSRIIDDGYKNFAKHCSESKIILLLRDPVERCYSQSLMRNRRRYRQKNVTEMMYNQLLLFEDKVKEYPGIVSELWNDDEPFFSSSENCMFEGTYVVHLRRLFASANGHEGTAVSRERVRIYWSDDFFANPRAVVADALAFVGADPSEVDLERITAQRYNAQPESQNTATDPNLAFPPSLRERMEIAIQPFNEELAEFLGETPPWMKTKEEPSNSVHSKTL